MSAMEATGESARDVGESFGSAERTELPPVDPPVEGGYRDRPMYEFRAQHRDEFLDGTQWSSPREIEPFSDPDHLVERVNPDFGDPTTAYDNNCADCTRSFEQSWRGHFEQAAGRSVEIQPEGGLGATGEMSSETEEWAGDKFRDIYDPEGLRAGLEAGGPGSSAIVHSEFVDRNGDPGGHAFNVVNDGGRIRVCDAQTHETFDWEPGTIRPGLGDVTAHRAMAWGPRGERIW